MSKNRKFEDALKRLEEIVEQMEGGEIELEKALGLFEEGIKLVGFCSSKLEETKKKIQILTKKGDRMVAQPFEGTERRGDGDGDSAE